MVSLSDYQTDTLQLLRDTNSLLTTPAQLLRWINLARNQTCLMTGCLEVLVAGNCPLGTSAVPGSLVVGGGIPGSKGVQLFQTIAGLEKYPYAYATPFIQANNPGVKAAVEVKQVAISWGSYRPAMTWMPWQDMQAYYRAASINVFNYPVAWSTTGDGIRGEVWLYPPPSVTGALSTSTFAQGEMEWLCSCIPLDLKTANDYEAIPEPYTNGVKFGAAMYAMLGAQRYGTADLFRDMWADDLGLDRNSVDRGQPGNYYWGV